MKKTDSDSSPTENIKPKRKMSCYNLFVKEKMDEAKQNGQPCSLKVVAGNWSSLSKEEKNLYKQRAADL